MKTFEELGVSEQIRKAIEELGFVQPMPVQEAVIPYLIDNQNCLFYEQGNYDMAIKKIEEIVSNKELRDNLITNGIKTAKSRQWSNIKDDIIKLYK